jgi:hypothetical protein
MKVTKPELLSLDFDSPGWPKTGDQLFRDGVDWQSVARLDMGGKEWASYTTAYRLAADLLAERFLEDFSGMDVLTYPKVYLYRHYVELSLKHMIVYGQRVLVQPVHLPEGHGLGDLWRLARPIIEEISASGHWPKDSGELSAVESLIGELNAHDPDGERFRYSLTSKRKGRQPALPNLGRVDIKNLFAVMQRLSCFLDGCIDGMSEIDLEE